MMTEILSVCSLVIVICSLIPQAYFNFSRKSAQTVRQYCGLFLLMKGSPHGS
jgi:hypothetical protein